MRRVPPVEQERLTLSDHSSSHPYFSWVRGARSLFLCVVFCRSLSVYSSIFILVIVLAVLLEFKASNHSFGIFQLVLIRQVKI